MERKAMDASDIGHSQGVRTALFVLVMKWYFMVAVGIHMLITAPRKWEDWVGEFAGASLAASWRHRTIGGENWLQRRITQFHSNKLFP